MLLSPEDAVCKACQSLFSEKNKKNVSKYVLKFLPSLLSINLSIGTDRTEQRRPRSVAVESMSDQGLYCFSLIQKFWAHQKVIK